jgi:hypothetical protein
MYGTGPGSDVPDEEEDTSLGRMYLVYLYVGIYLRRWFRGGMGK